MRSFTELAAEFSAVAASMEGAARSLMIEGNLAEAEYLVEQSRRRLTFAKCEIRAHALLETLGKEFGAVGHS